MIFHSYSVWFLLLLVLLAPAAWLLLVRRRHASIRFSSTAAAAATGSTWKTRTRWILPCLRLLAIALLIVAVARPQLGRKVTTVDSEGIAIELVVDRSGSMQAMDFEVDGRPVDRLTAIKDVAGKFVHGGDDLPGRFADLVGLVTFAGYADGVSPLTLDHSYLITRLRQTKIVTDQNEDGTAIGDAISLSLEKLQSLDARSKEEGQKVKSKIVILLTDGENNAGSVDPLQAAELAETLGIKVYTIGVGTTGRAPVPVTNPLTGRRSMQWAEVHIDEETLKKIAEATGGKYFRATDTESLSAIYEEIDQLEKSRVEERHYVDYRELAIEPVSAGFVTLPPLVLVALLLLALQCVLGASIYRQIP
jgi:Ca-activated chloride channel family protein